MEVAYLIHSLSPAAITIGEKGLRSIVLEPVLNLVSQLAFGLLSLLTIDPEIKKHIGSINQNNYSILFS
jgi:hypothetical protein